MTQPILNNNTIAFEEAYKKYYIGLCAFSKLYVYDIEQAKEVVQEVFLLLWEKRDKLFSDTELNLKAYLFKTVINNSLKYLARKKTENKYKEYAGIQLHNSYLSTGDSLPEPDVKVKIHEAIETLPPRCKEIFNYSRIDGLKHREIADRLYISEKTVEVQIRKASILLRERLKDYAPAIIISIYLSIN